MAKQADTGVYQLRNGNWAFRYTLTENGNKKDVRRSKNENGQKLRSMREAIVARYTKNIHFLSIHFWGWTGLHRRKNCHFYATFPLSGTGGTGKKEEREFPSPLSKGRCWRGLLTSRSSGSADPRRPCRDKDHSFSNASLPRPQVGQTQSAGTFSQGVPGAMPFSGSPTAGS